MEQGGMHPLQPTGPLINQILVETHQHPSVEDLDGRDPRFWHPSVREELAKVPGISPVGFGPALSPSQGGRLRRFGYMSGHARPY